MAKIFLNYVITPQKELLISSYHEPGQALSNAMHLMGKDNYKLVTKLQAEVPSPGSESEIKTILLELLIKAKQSGQFEKVIYKGDLNLCTSDKQPASFLFDGTLNTHFSEKEVHLILESMDKEYVEAAKLLADASQLSGAILQTKSGVKDDAKRAFYSYPKLQHQNSELDILSIPSVDKSTLAQPDVQIKDTQTLIKAVNNLGIFAADTTRNASIPIVNNDEVVLTPSTLEI